jgi:hypothetical protein
MKSMGQGMKSTVSGIGQAATAFATLSLSVVATWRAYRDLGDAQIAVDKANLRVKKTTEAIRKSEAEVAKLKKESAKGGLEQVAATHKIQLMEQKLAADRKSGKKTALELKVEEDAINLARKEGVPSSKKLMDAENKLALQKEQLGVQTDVAKEAQERFNDTQQNFYLSIAPLAISTIGTLATAFSGLKGMLTGGGGLVAGLGPIGLILGGITLAIIAFKTNFLGLRDAVGGVIDWLKARFGVWKDTIEKVFNLIRSGDWNGAFAMIKEAAAKFWEDLKKSNPFFGAVETLVNNIRNGKWSDAFNQIRNAAVFFWTELKKAIPFFGTIETVINNITAGDWEGAFKTIGESIMKGLGALGGEDLVLKIQRLRDTAVAEFNLMKDSLTKKGGPLDLIQQGLAKLGSGDFAGGFSQIWTGLDKAIGIATARLADWVKLNFGIDLTQLYNQGLAIGNQVLNGMKAGLTFVARTWIDPILVALLDPQTWITGFIAMGGFFVKIGTALYTAIGTALGNAAKDPKGTATWWADLGNGIWTGLSDWFTTNVPGATKALQGIAQSLLNAVETAKADFTNLGIAIWNAIIEGIRTFTGGGLSPFGGALDALKKNPVELPVKPIITPEGKTAIETWTKQNPIQLATGLNTKPADKDAGVFKNKVERQSYIAKLKATTQQADQSLKQFVNKVNNTTATIKIRAVAQAGTTKGFSAGAHFQHGYQGTVKRPTAFIAGEGGRPEDVTVRPRGSVQRGGSGGGGGSTHITVSFEPQEFAQFIRYRINDNQGVVK